MFTYSSKWIHEFAPNLACLFLDTRKIFLKGQNSKKVVMSSSPRKGDACSSETKHNRRMAPRPKMFVSRRRLQRGHNLKKQSLVRVPVKMISVAQKISMIKEHCQDK
jgi:hypothetical protein